MSSTGKYAAICDVTTAQPANGTSPPLIITETYTPTRNGGSTMSATMQQGTGKPTSVPADGVISQFDPAKPPLANATGEVSAFGDNIIAGGGSVAVSCKPFKMPAP